MEDVFDDITCHCFQFRHAARVISEFYSRMLLPSGITPCQFTILGVVSRLQPCTTSAVAERIGLDRTTLVRSLKPLIEKGLVQDLSQKGARRRQLSVSPLGLRTLEDALPRWRAAQEAVESHLGTRLLDAVGAVPEILDEKPR